MSESFFVRTAAVVSVLAMTASASAQCTDDAQCRYGRMCLQGACVDPPASACTVDTDCPDAMVCTTSRCIAPGAEPAERVPLGTFAGTIFVGPAFENIALGIGVGIGFMVGGTARFALAVRGSGPFDFSGDYGAQVNIDAGLRLVFQAGSIMPHIFLLADYGRMWEIEPDNDQTYEYNIFQARIGGGILFGTGRVRKGFELGVHIGKRIHTNADENPWDADYSSDGATFSGVVRFVLTI